MPGYELLDPAGLGQVVAAEEIPALSLKPSAIESIIAETEYMGFREIPYGSRVWRMRYTTQDRGRKVEATATVGIPANADPLPADPVAMAVFLHGTSGFSDPCAPSRSLDGQAVSVLLAALGFVAVAPDYIGMNGFGDASATTHGYLVGEQAAIGSWDAVRAAARLVETLDAGFVRSPRTVVWGASQGGHAALFMERYGPWYAPEIPVATVVAAVPPSALEPLVRKAVEAYSPPTVAFAAVLATMRRWYGRPATLAAELTDQAPYRFASTIDSQVFRTEKCDTAAAYEPIDDTPDEQGVELMYRQPFIDAVMQGRVDSLDPWGCLFRENSLATTSVSAKRFTPTLMVYSEKDDLVVTEPMRQDFDRLCAQGQRLAYLECRDAGHSEGAAWSLPDQLAWIRDRLADRPLPADLCARRAPQCCAAEPAERCAK